MHICGGEGLLAGSDPEGHQRQLKKKQKNRASAQRSRRKHTDKADALHQQHEALEKHNHALRKEIQGLRAELAWWGRTLHMHERLCLMGCASCWAPLPPGCWGQARRPLDPEPHRQHGCQEQPGLFQTPVSSPSAQPLSPHPQPRGSPGLLLPPLPWLPLGPTTITAPSAQLSPSPTPSASPPGSSLLAPSSELKVPPPHSSAHPAAQQPRGPEHVSRGKLVPSPLSPSAALGPACLQDMEHKPAFSAADQPGLSADLGPHPLQAFPLLSSAQVHF
ncbi:basic leucine zipper transcriptional factor ATF-like 2 isoform X1 [Myotis myotis]|uniref:Basic leucine zipper transcriptional factor ATF-like 2 n=2 Tax=Myotis myotis TaxID=51298 RepID=A0A7J7VGG7_MYOMY|nr:basic leucine zipper transcriptional factor ATF-like 2 isoform X1 [Myotis myotis]KAF6324100.1 basic leucine zipper ATF-like transcription factor 2 [Myotis myotis]